MFVLSVTPRDFCSSAMMLFLSESERVGAVRMVCRRVSLLKVLERLSSARETVSRLFCLAAAVYCYVSLR